MNISNFWQFLTNLMLCFSKGLTYVLHDYLIKKKSFISLRRDLIRKLSFVWNLSTIIICRQTHKIIISPLSNSKITLHYDDTTIRKLGGKKRKSHSITQIEPIVGRWDNSSEKLDSTRTSLPLSPPRDCCLAVDDSFLGRPRPNISASSFNLE